MAREKKPKAPKPPKSVDELVRHALTLAATNPKAKWTGASAKALFNTNEANTEAAIAQCTKADAPLLKQAGTGGVLTAAGFVEVSGSLPAEELTALAKSTAAGMDAVERVAFLQGAISRNRDAASELTPLLEAAVAEKDAALKAAAGAKAKQAAAAAANRAALLRAWELSKQDHENEINAVLLQWEALGKTRSELPAQESAPEPESRKPTGRGPEPRTEEEHGFRRDVAKQLADTWRAAWKENKHEGRDYLESAIWNVSGLRMIGEPNERTAFDGHYHECETPVFTGDVVSVVRPGWLLEEPEGDFVVVKAAVEKV